MISKIYKTNYPLNQFISHYYYYSGFTPDHSIDRFLPDGEVQLIIDLTDKPKFIYDNDKLNEIQTCKKAWFSAFRTKAITIPSAKHSEMIIVQFLKGRASTFLNETMANLTNTVIDADLLLKSDILTLREELIEQKMIFEKFQLLDKRFKKYYINHFKHNSFIDFAISKILFQPNQISIKEILESTSYSHKHICKLFNDNVGVSPKSFLKIIRFQAAIQQIDQSKKVDWASIAYDCGFYDQSHFISDFKHFSGFTPKKYLMKKNDVLNYIPII